jgi:UDP-N-acetylglucosamine 2-epimerase
MKNEKHSGTAIIIGTKAELIKCMPIMLELQKQKKNYWFIHTGQHSLKNACEEFGVKRPDFVLSKAPERSTKFWSKINKISLFWFLFMILKIKRIINRVKPKYVIYHGDTMSTAAASIASSKLLNPWEKWKNVHLEAGLRSGSLFEPFPEEISRKISDRFSDILLAVSDLTEKNLHKYKNKKKITKIGNTIIDSALISYNKAKRMKFKKPKGKYVLINIHRHENLNSKGRMEKIVKILKNVKIKAIWPIHANTAKSIEKFGLVSEVKNMKNLRLISLIDYFHFIFLLANCEYLITDGGSIQEESLVFKKPCIILRKKTERQEGLSTGINFLTKLNTGYAKKIIENLEKGKIKVKKLKNPYGNKGVSKKIVEELK